MPAKQLSKRQVHYVPIFPPATQPTCHMQAWLDSNAPKPTQSAEALEPEVNRPQLEEEPERWDGMG